MLDERLRLGFSASTRRGRAKRYVVEPFAAKGFAPGIDELKLNQLADALETEDAGR